MFALHRKAMIISGLAFAATVAAALTVAAKLTTAPEGMVAYGPAQPNVVAADNAFGFRLLNAVQKTRPQSNVVLSPVSAAMDLAIALNGASDETANELKATLSLQSLDLASINAGNAELIRTLRRPVKGVTLSVADAIFVDRHAQLSAAFLAQAQRWYDATIAPLDFRNPETLTQINNWASEQTHGRIPHVMDQMDTNEVAVLLNAVYFKGDWTYRFEQSRTQTRNFALADGTIKQVPRMSQSNTFEYFETPDVQVIRLPYTTGELAMDVFLPSKKTSLAAFEGSLTPEHWKAWQSQFGSQQGTLELPRFELRNDYSLTEPLRMLGMRRAFDRGSAQFQRMGAGGLSISYVKQSTFLKVYEEGSEAAAVTTIGIVATIAGPPRVVPFTMIVDRPFFCAIEDLRSHALLFVGAVYDPT